MYKPIPGFPGYYATSDGDVLSSLTGSYVKIAKRMHKGYLRVNIRLKLGRGRKVVRPMEVHRLILSAFSGPPPSKEHQCRHLDGDPLNNSSQNLCWGTPAENMADQRRHGTLAAMRTGDRSNAAKLTTRQVLNIRQRCDRGEPRVALAKEYGISYRHVADIASGKTWKHLWVPGGYLSLGPSRVDRRDEASFFTHELLLKGVES